MRPRKTLLILFVTVSLPLLCHAEVIKLKSGKTAEGKIIERTDQYVILEISGIPVKYYADEIESLDGQAYLTQAPAQNAAVSLQSPAQNEPSAKQTFKDETWGYSFTYPSNWEILPKEKTLEGFSLSLRPQASAEGYPDVTINIQRGRISESYLTQYLTSEELLAALIKFPAQTEHEPSKFVAFGGVSGYKIKAYKKKTIALSDLKGIEEGPIDVVYSINDDYYFFSPAFSGDRKDSRFFSIAVGYTLYSEIGLDNPKLKINELVQKFNSQFMLKNQKTQELIEQAKEIISSFSYSFALEGTRDKEGGFAVTEVGLPVDEAPRTVKVAPLTLGKLQELQEYIQKGYSLIKEGQYKEAIAELEKSLELNPDNAITLYYLGQAYFSLGQSERAAGYYQKILRIAPKYFEAYIGMGVVSASSGRFEEAIKYYRQALDINPASTTAHNKLALAYTSLGRYKEAIDIFKKSISLKADNAEAYLGLGLLYASNGQYQEAKENLNKAREILQREGDTQALKNIDDYLKGLPQ